MRRRQKTEFGCYLIELIKATGMKQDEFFVAARIKKPYFYDLLVASPPPIDVQNRMLAVFDAKMGADEARKRKFYDLAAKERNEIPADIAKLILDNPDKLGTIRQELEKLVKE